MISEEESGLAPVTGKSLLPILRGETGDRVLPERDHVLIGKERTDVGRPHDQGYPIRGLIRAGFLFLRNYEPARWPSGNPETGYLDTDGSPTKTLILENGRKDRGDPFWKLCFGKRPQTELYDLSKDPDCVTNLAGNPEHAARMVAMERFMRGKLTEQGDPRMSGKGDVFDAYPPTGNPGFYESYMKGERPPVNWVNPGDFERAPLD
jgi:N-sulfoglucosamine sulfohydrolase